MPPIRSEPRLQIQGATSLLDPSDPARKIHLRRPHKKSHLGCKNCKQRRVKCDEQLPCCTKCKRANAECSYLSYTEEQIADHREKQRLTADAQAAASGKPPTPTTSEKNYSRPSEYVFSDGPPPPRGLYTSPDSNASSPLALVTPPIGAATTLTPPPTDKYCKYYLPPINGHNPIPRTPVTLPALKKRLVMPPLDEQSRVAELDRRPLSETLKLTQGGFSTDSMREAYANWMSNTLALAFHHNCLYHAVMAFSQGFLYLKSGNAECHASAAKHRFIALREIQQEITKISTSNTDALLSSSLILSWDVFFQESRFESYMTISRGIGAVLEKVQAVSSTTQTALCMTESLFQSMKSILYPPYDIAFFYELIRQIDGLAPLINDSKNAILIEEYMFLKNYVDRMARFLELGLPSMKSMHDPVQLHAFLKDWLERFPSIALTNDRQESGEAQVLYAYYHAVTCALDNVLPEVRYLFQFSFPGPIDLMDPESSSANITDLLLRTRLQYPYRMISFFRKRQGQLSKLFGSSDLLDSAAPSITSRSRNHDLVSENTVKSFMYDVKIDDHMPYLSTGSTSSPASSSVHDKEETTSPPSPISSPETSSDGNISLVPPFKTPSVPSVNAPPPPLSSMSLGMFKAYFADRMEILQQCTSA